MELSYVKKRRRWGACLYGNSVSCGKCAKACKMDVDVTKTLNHTECIRCGMCTCACPTNAVCFRYGFGNGKETPKKTTMEESK